MTEYSFGFLSHQLLPAPVVMFAEWNCVCVVVTFLIEQTAVN
jgi:hypothetical protein